MAANLYVDILEATLAGVASYLPNMIDHINVQSQVAAKGRQEFFKAFPMLEGAEHQDTVSRLAFNYRQANPTIDQATFVKEVGVQALMALGMKEHLAKLADLDISLKDVGKTKPHVPAGTGGAGTVKVAEDSNEFTELASEEVN